MKQLLWPARCLCHVLAHIPLPHCQEKSTQLQEWITTGADEAYWVSVITFITVITILL